ncbi:TPA: hypothetical protein HA363_05145 [Candidatus Woesearchaeota archaeon]|nr:hypothetical protein [Candidatus Woesearchaeota archaeon]
MKKPSNRFKAIFAAVLILIVTAILLGPASFYNKPLWLGLIYFVFAYVIVIFFFFLVFRFFNNLINGQQKFVEASSIWPLIFYIINYVYVFIKLPGYIVFNMVIAIIGLIDYLVLYLSNRRKNAKVPAITLLLPLICYGNLIFMNLMLIGL